MKVELAPVTGGLYIQINLHGAAGSVCLRNWPWPRNEGQRARHLDEATKYGKRVALVLQCTFFVSAQMASEDPLPPNRHAMRRRQRAQLQSAPAVATTSKSF